MFFLPSFENLKKEYELHLLCLNNGNADNLGKIREIELEKCSKYLGIQNLKIVYDNEI